MTRGFALLALSALSLDGRHVTDPEPVHIGSPTASITAEAIIERYQMDTKLADELYAGKVVHIKDFTVERSGSKYLRMKKYGFTLRLTHPSDTKKLRKGETVKLYCEGQGLRLKNGKKTIRFDDCRKHLELD